MATSTVFAVSLLLLGIFSFVEQPVDQPLLVVLVIEDVFSFASRVFRVGSERIRMSLYVAIGITGRMLNNLLPGL
ncbi:hypothetical protein D8S78_19720 [Natrialba swarupiae]|nr:hypothetical protein [Natrialba swarupiae]